MKQLDDKWIRGIVRDFEDKFIETTGLTKADYEAYRNDNMFFITMHVDQRNLVERYPGEADIERVMVIFKKWYFGLCKRSLGNKLGQKLRLQPIGIAFADFNGSRARGSRGLESLKSGSAHIHAVLMVMPDKGQAFKEKMLSVGVMRTPEITDVEIRPFLIQPKYEASDSPFETSLFKLIDYCSKGYRDLPDSYAGKGDCYLYLPF
jgi:hypothetical protein